MGLTSIWLEDTREAYGSATRGTEPGNLSSRVQSLLSLNHQGSTLISISKATGESKHSYPWKFTPWALWSNRMSRGNLWPYRHRWRIVPIITGNWLCLLGLIGIVVQQQLEDQRFPTPSLKQGILKKQQINKSRDKGETVIYQGLVLENRNIWRIWNKYSLFNPFPKWEECLSFKKKNLCSTFCFECCSPKISWKGYQMLKACLVRKCTERLFLSFQAVKWEGAGKPEH